MSVDNPDFTWRPWWWDRSLEAASGTADAHSPDALEARFGDNPVEQHGRWLLTNGWVGYYDAEPFDLDPDDGLAPPAFSPLVEYTDEEKADLVANRLAYGGNDPEAFTLPPSTGGGSGGNGGSGGTGGNSAFAASGTGFGSVSGGGTDRNAAAAPSGDLSALPPGVVAYARTGPGWTDTLQPPAAQKPAPSANPSTDPLDALAAAIAAGDDRFGGQAAGASGIQPTGGGPRQPGGGPSRIDPNGILPGGFGSGLGVARTIGGFGASGTASQNGLGNLPPESPTGDDQCECTCEEADPSIIDGAKWDEDDTSREYVGPVVRLVAQGTGDEPYVLRPVEGVIYTVTLERVNEADSSDDPAEDPDTAEEWDAFFAREGTVVGYTSEDARLTAAAAAELMQEFREVPGAADRFYQDYLRESYASRRFRKSLGFEDYLGREIRRRANVIEARELSRSQGVSNIAETSVYSELADLRRRYEGEDLTYPGVALVYQQEYYQIIGDDAAYFGNAMMAWDVSIVYGLGGPALGRGNGYLLAMNQNTVGVSRPFLEVGLPKQPGYRFFSGPTHGLRRSPLPRLGHPLDFSRVSPHSFVTRKIPRAGMEEPPVYGNQCGTGGMVHLSTWSKRQKDL